METSSQCHPNLATTRKTLATSVDFEASVGGNASKKKRVIEYPVSATAVADADEDGEKSEMKMAPRRYFVLRAQEEHFSNSAAVSAGPINTPKNRELILFSNFQTKESIPDQAMEVWRHENHATRRYHDLPAYARDSQEARTFFLSLSPNHSQRILFS